jgi:hypothetical protein
VPRKREKHRRTSSARSVWTTILYMLSMGVVCVLVAIYSYSLEIKLGLSETTASKLPNYAFFVGLALGLGIALVRSLKDIFASLLAMLVLGGVFWFIGVELEAWLVAFGLSADIAPWISRIGFAIGVLLGSVTLFAVGQDLVTRQVRRLRPAGSNPQAGTNRPSAQ